MPDNLIHGGERDLLERLLRDDRDAWQQMVTTYSGLLLGIAKRTFAIYGRTPVEQGAEDVVAAVWSNVLANDRRIIRQCLRQGRLLPMLYTLTRNRAIDVLRIRKIETVSLDDHSTAAATPDEPALTELPLPELRKALATLTPRERTLIRLFYMQRKKYREIAALTGIAQNSIGPTIGRAIAKLRLPLIGPDRGAK